ncbi:MAG: ABC transporter permease [Pseudomonadales bacterium]
MDILPDIKLVLLWSDMLIFILVAALCVVFTLLKNSPQTRNNWVKVFQSRIGMATFIVIVVYVFIALLDSIHYQKALPATSESEDIHYSNEVFSTLDWVLLDMKDSVEKTYSSPFSLYSFEKENMHDEQGRMYRDYPRLAMSGLHITDVTTKSSDIFLQSINAVGMGGVLAVFTVMMMNWLRQRFLQHLKLPWSTIYITVFVILIAVTWVLNLGGSYHILGTDKVGIDVLYISIKSIRTGVLIGTLSTMLALPFAITLGISAGYFKGWVDDIIQYVYTTLSSIPSILLIAAAVLVIDVYIETHAESFALIIHRADFKFLALCFIFGLTSWTGLCRLLRAETLKVSQLDYVQAAQAFGVSHRRIIFRHILPNVMHLVIISLVLNFSGFVLAESVLAYVGVGVDASMMSWGNMINSARQELSRDPTVWWSIASAFILMFVLVLAANLFSDKVRDAFDPRTARGGVN